uniref:Uncharacterized protein n=1 Tax=Heterorhabditis bacteriophora TaxID=37862 RepID=A0A1I7WT38_HETBA
MSGGYNRDQDTEIEMEVKTDRRGSSSRRNKRLTSQSKTHPTSQVKQNQCFI